MFTTNPFSILAKRGMGEYDSPGTYRDMGGSGRGEKTVSEDVVGALLRFVRGNEGFSRPLACFSFSAVFLFQKRKSAKTGG